MIDFDQIGKYKVTDKLGQGSFGVVYKGRDPYLKRDVAIKVCSVEDEGLRQRFFREAEISGRLDHKNIVTVFEFGFEGKVPFLVQEMLSGEDLSRIVKRQAPLAPAAKLEILLQVASGLGYAHSEGVIHRDIKPANVRVLEDGTVKIMDFGIAKLASAETQLTQKGVTMGTASYLPPEQVRGSDLDHRADIFAFAVLAYELMTYERPFRGNTLSALVYQILYKVPQPMIDVWPEAPEPLSRLVARCLEKKPERRYGSFPELIPELTAVHADVRGGKWPALVAGAAAAGDRAANGADENSDVLSPRVIAQTARGALEGKVGDYTISTAVPASEVLRPAESEKTERSTRPIEVRPDAARPDAARPDAARPDAARPGEAPPEPPAAAPDADHPIATPPSEAETLKTRVLPTAEIVPQPPGGAASPDSEATGVQEDLATKAQEISDLVAQGRLHAAKEQLEATISTKDLTDVGSVIRGEASRGEAPPPEAAPGAPLGMAFAKTRKMHLDETAAEASANAAAAAPEAPTAGPLDAVASDTYRTMLGPPFDRLKWAGLAAAVVLVLALGWLARRDGGEAAAPPEPEPAPPPPAVALATAEPEKGAIFVNTATWAEITEITDAEGYLQELPAGAVTPLYLELPPGSYRVQLREPSGEEVRSCDLEVSADEVASCTPSFGETSVTEYFKESGWWK